MKRVVFTAKISRFGIAKMLIVYIPKSVRSLVSFGKEYKITFEELNTQDKKEL